MFEEEFEKLYESEKEEFKRVCNYLLSKTFVLRDVYDKQQKKNDYFSRIFIYGKIL